MAVEDKKYDILLIESDRDSRFYFSAALKSVGYKVSVAGNSQDASYMVETAKRNEIKCIIINTTLPESNFCALLQRLRNHVATFISDVILFSDEIEADTKFLLDELNIKAIFKPRTEAKILIDFLDKLRSDYNNKNEVNKYIYEFSYALKNKNLLECQKFIKNENLKSYLMSNEQYVSLYGEYLILNKSYQECHDFLNKVVKNRGGVTSAFATVSILNCLAKSLCHLEKFDDALMIYGQMAVKSPHNLDHKLNVSQVHLSTARWQSALNVLDVVLKKDPENKEALLKCAQANVGLGKIKEAKSFMEQVAGTTELNSLVSFYNNQGVVYSRSGDYEKALGFYKNALFFCEKDSSKIIFNIGLCLLKFNRLEEAVKIFSELEKLEEFNSLYQDKEVFKKLFRVC